MLNKRLPGLPPKLEKNPKMQKRDLDTSVDWADRWAEIEKVENEHKRLLWQVRWFTGMRGEMLRGLEARYDAYMDDQNTKSPLVAEDGSIPTAEQLASELEKFLAQYREDGSVGE